MRAPGISRARHSHATTRSAGRSRRAPGDCACRPSTRSAPRSRARCRCCRASARSPKASKTPRQCTPRRRAACSRCSRGPTRPPRPTWRGCSSTWTTTAPRPRDCSPPCSRAATTGSAPCCAGPRAAPCSSARWSRCAHSPPSGRERCGPRRSPRRLPSTSRAGSRMPTRSSPTRASGASATPRRNRCARTRLCAGRSPSCKGCRLRPSTRGSGRRSRPSCGWRRARSPSCTWCSRAAARRTSSRSRRVRFARSAPTTRPRT